MLNTMMLYTASMLISTVIGLGVPAPVTIVSEEAIVEHMDYTQHTTVKTLPNGDVFTVEKYEFDGGEDVVVDIPLGSSNVRVQYIDAECQWQDVNIYGDIPVAPLYVTTDKGSWLIEPAYHYIDVGSTSLEDVGLEQAATFTKGEDGVVCSMTLTNEAGVEAHYWTLQSTETLVPLDEAGQRALWGGYLSRVYQRYAYDGYYYATPSTYEPYSETMFWRNPGAYGPAAFTMDGSSRGARDLSYAWVDGLADNAEPEGYWLSYPKSHGFLYDLYYMDGGFYDTRFNADTTEVMFVAYRQTRDTKFLDTALAQMDFFVEFATNHHYSIVVDGMEGILVEDYYHPTDEYEKPHCSLNHQLAEINTLYLAYECTEDTVYLDVAEWMLQGVRNTSDMWVMEDHGLEYAYMRDGTMGLVDYPYLTYNDLFEVQVQREKMGMERDAVLDYLMSEKKMQMDAKGITGYKQ